MVRHVRSAFALVVCLGSACSDGGGSGGAGGSGASGPGVTTGTSATATHSTAATTAGAGGSTPCPPGVTCVTSFPFEDDRDTSAEGTDLIASYDCAPSTDESGPEILYRLTVPADGMVTAVVTDGAGVDIDVHVLADLDPSAPSGAGCLARDDVQASADVAAGDVWVVADTYVTAGGDQAGPFSLRIGFVAASEGPCDMETGTMPRVGDGGDALAMPATGPVARAGHLVTQEEPPPFPASGTEEIDAHYSLTDERTGLAVLRQEPWAAPEGDFFGAGVGDPAELSALDEAWYVTMNWTPAARPPKGTRLVLRRPDDPSRAVVVSGGFETGPSDLSRIAGASEEAHFYLRSQPDDTLELGVATDQSLPLGPRRCTP